MHVCVCLSVFVSACVHGYRGGKGAGQVNELIIRIDIASAVGFPQTMSTALSPSLRSSEHPLNSLCHLQPSSPPSLSPLLA